MNPIRAMLFSAALVSASLKRLDQICNQVGTGRRVRDARIGHAISRHGRLRVGNERIDARLVPGDAAALERGRIAKVRALPGLAPEHAVKARADALLVLLQRVTRRAFLEALGTALRVS